MQLTHYDTKFEPKQFPITLLCDNITNAPNIGSLFRTADSFGIEKLIFCGEQINIGRKMTKTSRSTEKNVNHELCKDASALVKGFKSQGYTVISLEITENSLPIHSFKFKIEKPIVLIVGDENFGISEEILAVSDTILHIDMFGRNSSMNVVQATNIALYEITKQIL